MGLTSLSLNERIPGVYVELAKAAQQGLPTEPQKIVFIGQKLAAGTATALVPVQVDTPETARTLFGRGSMLARMVAAAVVAVPTLYEVWACPMADEVAGATATATLTVAVSSHTAGTLYVSVCGDIVRVSVASTDTDEDIADNMAAAINAALDLPVTAAAVAEVVTLTARHKGTVSHGIDVSTTFSGTGLTVAVVAFASGTTDPDVQDALDALLPETWDVIVSAYADSTNLGVIKSHLTLVSDGVEQRPGVAVVAVDASVSSAVTLAGVNSNRILMAWCKGTATWAPELASAMAAVLMGEADLARPLNTLPLKGVAVPVLADRPTRATLTTALFGGLCPLVVADDQVTVLRSCSTYTEDGDGAADPTWLDIQTIRTADYARKALAARLRARFARVKIANVARSESTTDTAAIKMEVVDVLQRLEAIDYIEGVEDLLENVVVQRNDSDPTRVDMRVPVNITNGLHILAMRVDVSV